MLEGLFLVEGRKNVFELLKSSYLIEMVLMTKKFAETCDLSAFDTSLRTELVTNDLLNQLSAFKNNEEIAAVVHFTEPGRLAFTRDLFVLDGISDPGNLGTIIRTLDWFGYDQLLCSPDTADFYNPKTIAASMGSFSRVNVVYGDLVKELENCGKTIFGADMKGNELKSVIPNGPGVFVMGSESHGIRNGLRQLIHQMVAIPHFGNAESLNVGIATGIIAYHLRMSK